MHAGSHVARAKARTPHKVKFRADADGTLAVERVAAKYALVTLQEKATFFGLSETTWGRLLRGDIDPGEETIAAVLGSHPEDAGITFDALFEVVSP